MTKLPEEEAFIKHFARCFTKYGRVSSPKVEVVLREALAKIAALEAEVARLREALEPFAGHIDRWERGNPRIMREEPLNNNFHVEVYLGDLRKARAALSPATPLTVEQKDGGES